MLAIIGGRATNCASLVQLYKKAAAHAGHDESQLKVGSHSIGFVGENTEQAEDNFFVGNESH